MMLKIKEDKYLYFLRKKYLLLILSWLLGGHAVLEASQDIGQREGSIVPSIWGLEIDPALDWVPAPIHPAQSPLPFWLPVNVPFVGHSSLLIQNNWANMASCTESPFYHFPETSTVVGDSFTAAHQPASADPKPNNSPVTANIPAFPTQSTTEKEQPPPVPNPYMHKKKDGKASHKTKPSQPNECGYCKKSFSSKSGLTRHIRTHTNEKPFRCTCCDRKFAQKSNLKKHISIHSDEKPFQCPDCDKSFREKSFLKKHSNIHTNEKTYQCTYCGKRFKQRYNLTLHIGIHTGEKPFNCSYCSKKFSFHSNLKIHLRTHTKEKPYECSYCHKRFAHHNTLKTHVRTHTKEKPFQCSYCNKSFAQRSNLKRHIRIHTKEKPFQCAYCDKKFIQKNNLKKHVKSQHNRTL